MCANDHKNSQDNSMSPIDMNTRGSREGSFDSQDSSSKIHTQEERQELAQLARGLRRVKRQLLLMQVGEPPQTPVESFRVLLMKAAFGEGSNGNNGNNRSAPSSPTRQSGSGSFEWDAPRSPTAAEF
jgi:hypothetical protein